MENFDGRGCGIPFTIMLYQLTPGASRTKAVATAEVNFNSRKNGPCKRTADPKKNLQKKERRILQSMIQKTTYAIGAWTAIILSDLLAHSFNRFNFK